MILYGRGRDLIEFEKSVRFNRDTCRWEVLGEAGEVRISNERAAIIDVLENSPEPMSPAQIAEETGMKRANVRQLLKKLICDQVVIKGRSQYFRAKRPNNNLVNIRSHDHNERENEF